MMDDPAISMAVWSAAFGAVTLAVIWASSIQIAAMIRMKLAVGRAKRGWSE